MAVTFFDGLSAPLPVCVLVVGEQPLRTVGGVEDERADVLYVVHVLHLVCDKRVTGILFLEAMVCPWVIARKSDEASRRSLTAAVLHSPFSPVWPPANMR